MTCQHAVALKVAQGRGEHPLRYPRDAALEIREPSSKSRPAFQNENHQQAPLVSDTAQHVSELAVMVTRRLCNLVRSLGHCLVLPVSGLSALTENRHRGCRPLS